MEFITGIADWSMMAQIIGGLLLHKYMRGYIDETNSINTLVLMPIFPYLSLVLYALTRAKSKEYFLGLVFSLALIPMVIVISQGGPPIYSISIGVTCIVYAFSDGIGPVIIGLIIGWLCKDMTNPISFIISCNIVSNYIITRGLGLTTNKFKWSKNSYDNDGTMKVVGAGLLEAIFVGAPSDVISDNENMMKGMADLLCITNMLVNGSTRNLSTVVVTNWPAALIFFSLITLTYYYGDLDYVKEQDKVWPAEYSIKTIPTPDWELCIIIGSLIASQSLVNYDLVIRFILVIGLSLFVRIKVSTRLFFSSKILFS